MKYTNRTYIDWKFTDRVHLYVINKNIYNHTFHGLNSIEKASKKEDQENGIDYWLIFNNTKYAIQERFRELYKYTENSFEFTIRFQNLGKNIKNYEEDSWNNKISQIVLFGLKEKFTQNEYLKNILKI